MEERDGLREYYEHYDEDGRLTSRHGMVEYTTTMGYLERYLRPGVRILEVGAGTGRYSHALARRGYQVDGVELVEHNIALFRANTLPGEPVTVCQGDARDLSAFGDGTYDLTLLLGPMYHLFTDEDRLLALSEAVRVTKRGGVIFAAYCMGDAVLLSHGFAKGQLGHIMESCGLDGERFDRFPRPLDFFALYRREDIDRLRGALPVEQLHFVAADGYASHMRRQLAEMDEGSYRLYLNYHLATCERPDMVGISHHTLDIFREV